MDVGNEFGFVQTFLPQHIIAIRLLIAAVLGAMIGFEREWNTAEAGLRTHILIAVAAALFTILAFEIYHTLEGGESRADPIRAVEAVTERAPSSRGGAMCRGSPPAPACGSLERSGWRRRLATISSLSAWPCWPYWCWPPCGCWRTGSSAAITRIERGRGEKL